jgi:membrane protease YdiL (CAAX protease family)
MCILAQSVSAEKNRQDKLEMDTDIFHLALVMNLFGRRERGHMSSRERLTNSIGETETSIKDAMLAGTLISVFSGISEEVIFRGMISTGVYYLSHSVLIALTVQAALFGLVHHSPSAPKGENEVMVLHQSLLGFWLGIVLILSGGSYLQ